MTVYALRPDSAAHASPGHPERPARLDAVRQRLAADAALAGLVRVEGEPAADGALARVHTHGYLDRLAALCDGGGGSLDADTYVAADSCRIARQTAGDLLAVVDRVVRGEARNGFAIGRPPGHHATPEAGMGFCLLSNLAVAARHAQAAHGVERVLVVDVDVHHGNGTQDAFYADPSVLTFSSHQAGIYPGTGAVGETGAGAGGGFCANLPLPAGTTDGPLLDAYRQTLVPLADRFRPDLVLVAAGYDAHRLDPLAGLALSVAGLTDLVRVALEVADRHAGGRLVASLEGGYNADVLGHAVASTLRVLLDPSAEADDPLGPTRLAGPSLDGVVGPFRAAHRL